MRHHGVETLKIAEDWNSEQLQDAIKPDQNEWLSKWMSCVADNSLKKLLRRLRFTESLEMLSVYSCVMNDSTTMAYSIDQLKARMGDITKTRIRMIGADGREASPAVVLKSVMEGL